MSGVLVREMPTLPVWMSFCWKQVKCSTSPDNCALLTTSPRSVDLSTIMSTGTSSIQLESVRWKCGCAKMRYDLVTKRLRETPKGKKYVVTLVDYFSKWPEAESLPDKTANGVAMFLYSLFCRFARIKTVFLHTPWHSLMPLSRWSVPELNAERWSVPELWVYWEGVRWERLQRKGQMLTRLDNMHTRTHTHTHTHTHAVIHTNPHIW